MSILNLLSSDNFIAVNKSIAAEVGLEAAVVLGELASEFVYWQSIGGLEDGFFYSTIENLEKRTFLSGYSQRLAISKLQEKGWIEVKRKGIPAKRYVRIIEENLLMFFDNKMCKILTSGDSKFEQQDVENFDGKKNITKNKKEKEMDIYIENKPKKQSFVPPTLEEVRAYCFERGSNVDPQKFFDYYEEGEWKDSKGKPVKNWKQKLITWERNSYSEKSKPAPASSNPFTELRKQEGYTI